MQNALHTAQKEFGPSQNELQKRGIMSIQWAIDRLSAYHSIYGKPKRYQNNDARRCDKEVKYCSNCNRCWEFVKIFNDVEIEHYSDFEKLGKERKICPICRKA
jgi:hypothetical protein